MYLKLFQERKFNRIRELFKKKYACAFYKQNEAVFFNLIYLKLPE